MLKKATAFIMFFCLMLSCFVFTATAASTVPGDVDADGIVSSADARLALRASVRLETLGREATQSADVDRDGQVTSADARVILRISVKLDAIVDGQIVPYGYQKPDAVLNVGYPYFNGMFSPFFSETAYDQDVWSMTSVNLLGIDRLGAVVEKGISGKSIPYHGTDYTYPGIADMTVTINKDGTVDYDFVLREGVTFSDGQPLTVDDVIFSMYVLADPSYYGTSAFASLPIDGLSEYRADMELLVDRIFNAGRYSSDYSDFTKAQQVEFWNRYDAAVTALVRDIVSYCREEGLAYNPADAASVWGFDGAANESEFAAMLTDAYGANLAEMISVEAVTISLDDVFPNFFSDYYIGIKNGASVNNIRGIIKTGRNSLRIHMTQFAAPSLYQLGITIAPLHYYGSASLYDYSKNRFGFPKGDLSGVRAKSTKPLGAGPYVFKEYKNGVVTFTANENYYLGTPKIKTLRFIEAENAWEAFVGGSLDAIAPAFSRDTADAISALNSNRTISGNKAVTYTVDNLGYGYLGISAKAVNVGGNPGSTASKNLRKAFATVFSVFRDESVSDYYGEAAEVINYPISDTSWAAPQKTDAGYREAFSTDVNGKAIYKVGMNREERIAAALQAALGFFKAAGYTVRGNQVVAAPSGARMAYDLWIPADGFGDHPSYMMACLAADALASIGVSLNVIDLTNDVDLWSGLVEDWVDMWCAAWGATPDPDMYQLYYSGVATGYEPGGSNYMYDIADAQLDRLILEARGSADQSYRKRIYKQALDIIIDWAVEVPVYQRQNAIVFSPERVKISTLTPDITTYYGWLSEIQNVEVR